METKIRKVVSYSVGGANWYDVFYKSGRCAIYQTGKHPATVHKFIMNAKLTRVINNYVIKGQLASVFEL